MTKEEITNEIELFNKNQMCAFITHTETCGIKLFMDLEIDADTMSTITNFNSKTEEEQEEILSSINEGLHIIKPSKNPGGSPNG